MIEAVLAANGFPEAAECSYRQSAALKIRVLRLPPCPYPATDVPRSKPLGVDGGVPDDGRRLLQSYHILRPNDLRLTFKVDTHFGVTPKLSNYWIMGVQM
jgi:hypothetical protein